MKQSKPTKLTTVVFLDCQRHSFNLFHFSKTHPSHLRGVSLFQRDSTNNNNKNSKCFCTGLRYDDQIIQEWFEIIIHQNYKRMRLFTVFERIEMWNFLNLPRIGL